MTKPARSGRHESMTFWPRIAQYISDAFERPAKLVAEKATGADPEDP